MSKNQYRNQSDNLEAMPTLVLVLNLDLEVKINTR